MSTHKCVIAVCQNKAIQILVHSEPSLLTNDLFDGTLLEYNLDLDQIPSDAGVYTCVINMRPGYEDPYTGEIETEVEVTDIKDIKPINLT